MLGDTVLDPTTWPRAMDAISAAVASTGAALLQSDIRTPDIPRTESTDEFFSYYFRSNLHYGDIRARRGVPLLLGGTSVVIDQDVVTPDEMDRDPLYAELLRFGFQWFAVIGFRAGSALWGLSIQRTSAEGPFDRRDKKLLGALSRRLTEVASLSDAVGRVALSSATNALSSVRQAAVAIDRFGFVFDANPAAQALFDDAVCVRSGRLFVADPHAKSCLEKLLERLRIASDTDALPCDPLVVRRRGRAPIVVRVLPVHGAARTPFLGARALLTFTPIEPRPGPTAALLSGAFGLSPAEARLASIIAEGVNAERAAEELGVSRETARSQLKAIFAKTGTHRQMELVALFSKL